jgi:hypothetical protein
MKTGLMLGLGALAVAAVAVAAVPVQDAKAKSRDEKTAAGAHGGMDKAAMEARMKELGTPGPAHAELKKMVGTWEIQMKCWEDPSQPPQESSGTSQMEMSFDRHLVEHFTGTLMGQPYEGTGLLGFNNATKEYEHVWRDSMNTGMMWSHGTKSADGTLTMTGESNCAMGPMSVRTVSKVSGDNAMHFEMYGTISGMPEMKMMEMDYSR